MPKYTFKISDDGGGLEDNTGVILPNAASAYHYACEVVGELMDRREHRTRAWRLDVYENATKIFEIPFAGFDSAVHRLAPERRGPRRSPSNALNEIRIKHRDATTLVPRWPGNLSAESAKKVIPD
jgi:hypothetical protein